MRSGDAIMIEVEPGVSLAVEASPDIDDRARPAILFSHSLAADSGMWDELRQRLAPHARLILADTRGHGRSSAPAAPYTLDRLGLDAVAVLDALGIDRAVICGLSLGGLVGQWLGIYRPERIAGLALANTASSFPPPSLWQDRAKQVLASGLPPFVAPTLGRWLTERFQAANPARTAEIAATIAATSRQGYAGCCTVLADSDLSPSLSAIACPTIVLAGWHDPSTTPAQAATLTSAISGAKLIELDAAHLSAVEAPEAFAQAIISFLPAAAGR
ncbi:MAG TPA: alpha/beta fold hydrolase [Stellaceae bacterium]|jgi:3-oxoadipate enol-lactonase|nr:alpha/beta fold hydrolase [Stellaceae bacterium]